MTSFETIYTLKFKEFLEQQKKKKNQIILELFYSAHFY